MHPLRKRAKWHHIYPCLKKCSKGGEKEEFTGALKHSILKEMNLITPEYEEIQEDMVSI